VRIHALDELPAASLPQLAAFGPLDGDPPQGIEFIRQVRRWGLPASDYYGLYAVEDGEVLSRVESLRLRFTTRQGREDVVGISDVSTRPEGIGRGYARSLLTEVHRREVERGRRWSFLWTHRSWGAHRLYESLGYEDVYSPPTALRPIPRAPGRRLPKNFAWGRVTPTDARRLERILHASTNGRVGFVPRFPGSISLRFRTGWRKPENHRLLLESSKPIGYAHLLENSRWNLTTNEVVVTDEAHLGSMVDALEVLARGRWLTLHTTSFVTDTATVLRERGYRLFPSAHLTLMAKALVESGRSNWNPRSVCQDPSFSCHRGDVF